MAKDDHKLTAEEAWQLIEPKLKNYTDDHKLTADDAWQLIELKLKNYTDDRKLTPDGAWQLVEPKLKTYWESETWKLVEPYWKSAKLAGIVISSLLGAVVTVLVATVSIDAVKDGLVNTVVRIDKQLGRKEAQTVLRAEFKDYLAQDDARVLLKTEFRKYLLENEEPAALFATDSKAPLRLKGEQILDARMNEKFSGEIKNVRVKHSFGISFSLSNEETGKSYSLRFIKAKGSSADIDCDAVYPDKKVRNAVYLKLNDKTDPEASVTPKPDSFIGAGSAKLGVDNSKYFLDPSREREVQNINFQVDDSTPFSGLIKLSCTIEVISPASRI